MRRRPVSFTDGFLMHGDPQDLPKQGGQESIGGVAAGIGEALCEFVAEADANFTKL